MLNNRRDAISGVFSTFRVSAWSVRRKVVAVLALPVILAVVFGGLRVSSELTSASDYSTNQQRSTVLGPAITVLALILVTAELVLGRLAPVAPKGAHQ